MQLALVMTDEALSITKKVIGELFTWFVLSAISCGISTSIVRYFIEVSLAHPHIYQILISISMISFGIFWFLISAILLYRIWSTMRKYVCLPFFRVRVRELSIDEVTCFIKDVVSLYRGYRWYIIIIGILALITGITFMMLSTQEYIARVMSMSEFIFRFSIGFLTFFYGFIGLYLEEVFIAKKLAKVKYFENKLSKFLE